MAVTRKVPVKKRRGHFPPPGPVDIPIRRRDVDRRALAIGLAGTLLFHFIFLVAVPRSLVVLDPIGSEADRLGQDLEITLADDEEQPPEPPQPRYVETNPDAPENEPDETNNFSARNQQAANETVPDELSPDKTPAREGRDDVPFDKAFAGSTERVITVQPAPATPAQRPQAGQQGSDSPAAENPPSGFDETRGEDPEGIASSVAKPAPNPKAEAEPTEGADTPQRPALPEIAPSVASPERPAPAPRPRLPRASPGPVKRQTAGVSQTGRTAVNANFGPFGDYLERMQEAIQQRWDALGRQRSISETQTRVVLEFTITREGMIRNLETVDTTSKALGTLICRTAIEQGQSYGEWSREMVALLGEDETVVFTFYYW